MIGENIKISYVYKNTKVSDIFLIIYSTEKSSYLQLLITEQMI